MCCMFVVIIIFGSLTEFVLLISVRLGMATEQREKFHEIEHDETMVQGLKTLSCEKNQYWEMLSDRH